MILEPVQNAGGCFVPPDGYFERVREICDRHDVLMISDEVICAWGRLGHYFGCERFGYVPDIITVAKALTSAYAPMGALIASDAVAAPFMEGDASFAHGFTFAGHPLASAVAMANLDIFEREDLCGHVLAKEGEFRQMLETLHDIPIVGDVRGAGYFQAIELVKDRETKESFDDEESEDLLRGFLSGELYKRGLICRADDRGDPVVQLAPPLIADTEQFEEIHDVLHGVLSEAWERVQKRASRPSPARAASDAVLTVQSLLDELDLDLAAGDPGGRGAGALGPHLRAGGPDPVALGRRADADHRHPARAPRPSSAPSCGLLADHNLAGLGFGTGFNHEKLPKALVEEAKKRDFPLFEVPYSTPFIAITEKAFARLVNEQYEVLQRGIAVQRRLERLVLEERGLEEIVATIASAVGGTVAILGGRGERLAGTRLPPRALRRGGQGDPRGSARPHRRRPPLRSLATRRSPGAPSPTR